MIYELAIVAKTGLAETELKKITSVVEEVLLKLGGELMIADEWGRVVLAQSVASGENEAHFFFYIYKGNGEVNNEIARRLKNNENVLRHLVVQAAPDEEAGNVLKNYKTPFSKKYAGSIADSGEEEEDFGDVDLEGGEGGRGKKKFSRSRSCWFESKNILPTWKDPATYTWLLNEFGKISPQRVTGISRKYQRFVDTEIKRARNVGIISYVSNKIAYKA
jgi:small subunit ribosomal protein S6